MMRWYYPTRFEGRTLDEIRELMAPFGVTERRTTYSVYYKPNPDNPQRIIKAIGNLIYRPASQRLEVWPYAGASEREVRVLWGSAEQACSGDNKPSKANDWTYVRRGPGKSYWRSRIVVPLDKRDEWCQMIAADLEASGPDAQEDADRRGIFADDAIEAGAVR